MITPLSKLKQVSDAALAILIMLLLAGLFCMPAFSRETARADTTGAIVIQMQSALPRITDDNRSYSLERARFGVYDDYECARQVGEIVTDSTGKGVSSQLPCGRYYLRQLAASSGYVRSAALLQADIEIDQDASVEAGITPDFASPDLLLFESNAETGSAKPTAAAQFADARFTLSYYDSSDDAATLVGPARVWEMKTDAAGEVHLDPSYLQSGSPFFEDAQGAPVLPLGRYVFTLTEPPLGCTLASQSLTSTVKAAAEPAENPSAGYEPVEAEMRITRGDFMFRKIDENQNAMPNIPFLLSYSNGEPGESIESHVIVTDANGDFASDAARTAHTEQTNANDAAVVFNPDGSYTVDSSKLDWRCGVWFSMDETQAASSPDDARGALPYGTYRLQELPCETNAGMNLSTTQFTIYKDDFTVTLDTIVNTTPAISGFAYDAADRDKLLRPQANALIASTVSYQNLIPNSEYVLYTSVICKETGEQVCEENGEPAAVETVFTPREKDGTLQVEIAVDASSHTGKELVVCNELQSATGMVVYPSSENEAGRSLEVEPIITAHALDATDEDSYIMGKDARIVERVDYNGFKAGDVYTVKTSLVDKATGNAVRDNQGSAIVASKPVTPDETDGSVSLEMPVDATALEGHDIVVFTQISLENGRIVANLQDIEDASQTVKTVKLTTSACDREDGDKLFDGASNDVRIVDTVKYANLEPNVQYRATGVLMNKETGTALLVDGKEITASASFVPDEISGSVDVEFDFDASASTSDVLVAFETVTCNDLVVAEHVDLDDVAQTVTRADTDPDIVTGALDVSTPDAISGAGSTGMPKTGDTFSRPIALCLIALIAICVCIAYASHRRTTKGEKRHSSSSTSGGAKRPQLCHPERRP